MSKSQEIIKERSSGHTLSYPLVADLGSKKTPAYSNTGFATYIVDREGKIAAVLPGTKMRRPMSKKILTQLDKVAGGSGTKGSGKKGSGKKAAE